MILMVIKVLMVRLLMMIRSITSQVPTTHSQEMKSGGEPV